MASTRDDITDEVRANAYRAQAEAAYRAALNAAPPGHLPGESIASYRVRLATGLKPFSQTYKAVADSSLAGMYRAGALRNAEDVIYREAVEHARRPVGALRETQDPPDRSGRVITRFFGSPEDCWSPFKQMPRLARFKTGGR